MRAFTLLCAALVVLFGAVIYNDITRPNIAEASGGSSKVNLSSYSGNVGISGTLTVTGPAASNGVSVSGVTSGKAVYGSATTGIGVHGQATSGTGVRAESATGYALIVAADTTSPSLGGIRFDPANANPSAAALLGDIFVYLSGSTLVPRMATSTTPVWDDIGSFLSVATASAAAAGTQAGATTVCNQAPLTAVTTVAGAGHSVKFPASQILGKICEVYNKGANAMALYPASGGSLCVSGGACLATDASTSVAANDGLRCWHQGGGVWNCR